jgi:transposase
MKYLQKSFMRKDDARKLDHNTLEQLRIRAVSRVQAGESPELVARAIGINRTTIYDWLAKYRNGGWSALKSRPTPGAKPKIDSKKMKWIFKVVSEKNPQQLKFEFALWTREMVQELIKKKFNIKLGLKAVGRLLAQLGLTCQKPLYRAIQKEESLVKKWLKKTYPNIKARAKQEGADIYFADAAHIRSDHHAGKTWGVKGQTPVVVSTGARYSFSLISAVSARGLMRFMVTEGGVNTEVFIQFLKRLIANSKKKIFLIVDNGPSHTSKKTKEFVSTIKDKLELFYLPPYSPDLNPDELVWNHLKTNTVGRSTVTNKTDFKRQVKKSMKKLQNDKEKVRSFFQKKSLMYAA